MRKRAQCRLLAPALLALTALLAVLGAPAFAQQPAPKIVDIVVVGNKYINRESIIAASGLKIGDTVTQAALNEATRRLLLTQNFGGKKDNPEEGVRVEAQIEGDKAKVVIMVDENEVVQGINLSGTGPIPAAEVMKQIETKIGRPLNMTTLKGDIDRIQRLYEQKGYQGAVSSDIGITNGILNIPIIVATIDKVKITNNKKTRPFVILREMKLKPGDYFNVNTLQKDVVRIYNTDLFENLDPTLGFPSPGKVDINLNVQEKRTGTVSVFVGYSSRNNLVGGAEIGETNLFGRGQAVSLRWDTGGLANRSSFELGFTEPWLDNRHTSLSVNVYDKTIYRFAQSISSIGGDLTNTSTDYYEVRTGGQITLSRPFKETYRGYVGLRYDNVRVPALAVSPVDAVALQNGPLAALNFRVTHNTRDYDMEPEKGGYEIYSIDVGQAHLKAVEADTVSPVTGNVFFQKLQIDARRYFAIKRGPRKNPKDRRPTIALRLMGGSIAGKTPFFEQFFVGGAETLRGYREDRFWGKNMFLTSVEYRAPLASSLTGVLFMDAGDAWGGPYQGVSFNGFVQHTDPSPSVGFGLGLRVVTPIGPIRIDEGFGSEGARTHFSIGHQF